MHWRGEIIVQSVVYLEARNQRHAAHESILSKDFPFILAYYQTSQTMRFRYSKVHSSFQIFRIFPLSQAYPDPSLVIRDQPYLVDLTTEYFFSIAFKGSIQLSAPHWHIICLILLFLAESFAIQEVASLLFFIVAEFLQVLRHKRSRIYPNEQILQAGLTTTIIQENVSIIRLAKVLEIYSSKITSCPIRRSVKRLSTSRLPKYCPVIPYAFPSLAVLFVVLPFSDQASYSVNITLVWGANLEADITLSLIHI